MSDKEKRKQLVLHHGIEDKPADSSSEYIPSCGPRYSHHKWYNPDLNLDGNDGVVGVSTCWKCGMVATEGWSRCDDPVLNDPFEGVRYPIHDDGPIEIVEVKE